MSEDSHTLAPHATATDQSDRDSLQHPTGAGRKLTASNFWERFKLRFFQPELKLEFTNQPEREENFRSNERKYGQNLQTVFVGSGDDEWSRINQDREESDNQSGVVPTEHGVRRWREWPFSSGTLQAEHKLPCYQRYARHCALLVRSWFEHCHRWLFGESGDSLFIRVPAGRHTLSEHCSDRSSGTVVSGVERLPVDVKKRRGQSAAFLKELRRRNGLGEFASGKRKGRRNQVKKSRRKVRKHRQRFRHSSSSFGF